MLSRPGKPVEKIISLHRRVDPTHAHPIVTQMSKLLALSMVVGGMSLVALSIHFIVSSGVWGSAFIIQLRTTLRRRFLPVLKSQYFLMKRNKLSELNERRAQRWPFRPLRTLILTASLPIFLGRFERSPVTCDTHHPTSSIVLCLYPPLTIPQLAHLLSPAEAVHLPCAPKTRPTASSIQ